MKGEARSLRCSKRSDTEVAEIQRFFEAKEPGQKLQGVAGSIAYMSAKQNRLLATMERKQKLMNGASDEIQRRFPKEVLVSEEKISEVENSSRCKEGGAGGAEGL